MRRPKRVEAAGIHIDALACMAGKVVAKLFPVQRREVPANEWRKLRRTRRDLVLTFRDVCQRPLRVIEPADQIITLSLKGSVPGLDRQKGPA